LRIAYLHYLQRADTACNHVCDFARAASDLGHDVTVHAMNLAGDDGIEATPSLRIGRALKQRFRRYLHEPKELCRNLIHVQNETRILQAARPDVLLVRDHSLTASCVPVAHRLRLPLVLEVDSPAAEIRLYQDEYWHLPRVAEWLEGWKLRRAAAVTVVSSPLRDHLARRHAIPLHMFTVVPNGADTNLFRPDVLPDPELRDRLRGGPVIGFVGSFQKWHGMGLLARLMLEVARVRPQSRFVLVGDGPEATSVLNQVSGLDGQVLVLGRIPHAFVPRVVATFDIAVAPDCAFYMSPLKVIEWMAAGRAIVAPDHAALRDIIDGGRHGLLFPPGDFHALVSAVLRLIDDAPLRRSLGRTAAARAASSLSWHENARQVMAVCEQASSGQEPKAAPRSCEHPKY